MDISDIKALLADENPQARLRGLVALKDHDKEAAVPVLLNHREDDAFLVRSFVAMGLGRKQNEAAYNALLEMLETEPDNNVQAEIANSLGLYGEVAAQRLMTLFYDNTHWLVRRSILAIVPEMDRPDLLLEIATAALGDSDKTIAHAGIATLGMLADTEQAQTALERLLPLLQAEDWRSRLYLAHALKAFDAPEARDTLAKLRQDKHHKVIAAALEDLLPS